MDIDLNTSVEIRPVGCDVVAYPNEYRYTCTPGDFGFCDSGEDGNYSFYVDQYSTDLDLTQEFLVQFEVKGTAGDA